MLVRQKKITLIYEINVFSVKAWDSCIMYKRWLVYKIQVHHHRLLSIKQLKMEETFFTSHLNLRYAVIAFVLFQFTHVKCKMHKHDQSTPYLYIGIYIEVVSCACACSAFFVPLRRSGQPAQRYLRVRLSSGTFLMNINVCRTDKLYAIMQHKVYTTIIKKFFLN